MTNQNFYAKRLFIIQELYDIKKSLYKIHKKIKALNSEDEAEDRLYAYLTGKLTKLPPYMDEVLEDVRGIQPFSKTKI